MKCLVGTCYFRSYLKHHARGNTCKTTRWRYSNVWVKNKICSVKSWSKVRSKHFFLSLRTRSVGGESLSDTSLLPSHCLSIHVPSSPIGISSWNLLYPYFHIYNAFACNTIWLYLFCYISYAVLMIITHWHSGMFLLPIRKVRHLISICWRWWFRQAIEKTWFAKSYKPNVNKKEFLQGSNWPLPFLCQLQKQGNTNESHLRLSICSLHVYLFVTLSLL